MARVKTPESVKRMIREQVKPRKRKITVGKKKKGKGFKTTARLQMEAKAVEQKKIEKAKVSAQKLAATIKERRILTAFEGTEAGRQLGEQKKVGAIVKAKEIGEKEGLFLAPPPKKEEQRFPALDKPSRFRDISFQETIAPKTKFIIKGETFVKKDGKLVPFEKKLTAQQFVQDKFEEVGALFDKFVLPKVSKFVPDVLEKKVPVDITSQLKFAFFSPALKFGAAAQEDPILKFHRLKKKGLDIATKQVVKGDPVKTARAVEALARKKQPEILKFLTKVVKKIRSLPEGAAKEQARINLRHILEGLVQRDVLRPPTTAPVIRAPGLKTFPATHEFFPRTPVISEKLLIAIGAAAGIKPQGTTAISRTAQIEKAAQRQTTVPIVDVAPTTVTKQPTVSIPRGATRQIQPLLPKIPMPSPPIFKTPTIGTPRPPIRIPKTPLFPPISFDFRVRPRKKKKKRLPRRLLPGLAISEGFTAKVLKLPPVIIKTKDIAKIASSPARGIGIRRAPIIGIPKLRRRKRRKKR